MIYVRVGIDDGGETISYGEGAVSDVDQMRNWDPDSLDQLLLVEAQAAAMRAVYEYRRTQSKEGK